MHTMAETATTTSVAYGDAQVSDAVEFLEANWESIAAEYQAKAGTIPSDYLTGSNSNAAAAATTTEHTATLHRGQWDWHSYMRKGVVEPEFAQHFPRTAAILSRLKSKDSNMRGGGGALFDRTPFGYAFFSTLHGRSSIDPHTSPVNFRLRIHLPLVVPRATATASSGTRSVLGCGIRVGSVARAWQAGKALVLDDSYEHEVWNDTDETRVLLLVDIWHPDVTLTERREIVEMFRAAQVKGWLSANSQPAARYYDDTGSVEEGWGERSLTRKREEVENRCLCVRKWIFSFFFSASSKGRNLDFWRFLKGGPMGRGGLI
jgi:Aspartyl/Asparaginyl beta-hydroxylase